MQESTGWDGAERRAQHWHLKKEVTVGQLLTLSTLLVSGVGYVIANERAHERHALRIDSHERLISKLEDADKTASAKIDSAVARIEATVQRVDDKLDRLIEKWTRK